MKKRIVQSLLLGAMIACLSASSVAPIEGQNDTIITDVAAQKKTTEITISKNSGNTLHSGISEEIGNYIETTNYKNKCLAQKKTAWTTSKLNVRDSSSLNGNVVKTLEFNVSVEYFDYGDNKEWVELVGNDNEKMYINSNYISDTKCEYQEFAVPNNKGFKSYMSYKSITSKPSPQYKLQHNFAYTGTYGIRQVGGRYCVAVGTAFGADVGTYIDLVLSNGTIIPCVIGDIKADIHTESNNIVTASNGCVSEFVCDVSKLDKNVKTNGDISYANENWNSKVVTIKIYDKNVLN